MEKITSRDLLSFRFPENLKYSPSGNRLAYQLAYSDEEKNSYRRDIWMIENGNFIKMTDHYNASIVMWLDEDDLLIQQVTDKRPVGTELLKLNVITHEITSYLKLNFGISRLEKLGEDRMIGLGSYDYNDPDGYLDDEETVKKKQEARKKDADYEVVDEIPYWFNGQGFVNRRRTGLFIVDVRKAKAERITSAGFNARNYVVDGNMVYFSGDEKKENWKTSSKLYCYDLGKGVISSIYEKDDMDLENMYVLNNALYIRAGFRDKETKTTDHRAYCIKDGQWQPLPYIDRSLYDGVATDIVLGSGTGNKVVGDALYTIATDVDHTCIWKIDGNNECEELLSLPLIGFMDVCDDRIAFAAAREDSLLELYEMNIDGSDCHKLTSYSDEYISTHYVAKPQEVIYESHGEKLNGWVLAPKDYDPEKKYPAVLDVHGGPRGIYSYSFFHEMQIWASEGYFVFFTNIHGSDGRGNEFADIYGRYGTIDYDNLMDFTDEVIRQYPAIDVDNICVTGGSYGGFMTNWIIGHTTRFKAAASQRSISNWMSFGFISDIGEGFNQSQHKVDDAIQQYDVLWNFSPLKYAGNAKTPTLFIHSDEDYRCPLPEGMQMMQALKYYGVETRLVLFHGENHELSRGGKPLHRIRRLDEITGWFNKHVERKG